MSGGERAPLLQRYFNQALQELQKLRNCTHLQSHTDRGEGHTYTMYSVLYLVLICTSLCYILSIFLEDIELQMGAIAQFLQFLQ